MISFNRKNLFTFASIIMVGACLSAHPCLAEDELLTRARQLREVATQKKENDARLGLTEAARLAKFSPTRAAEHLKPILESIESDEQLSAEKRSSLSRMISAQIKQYERNPQPGSKNIDALTAQAEASGRLVEIEKQARENERLARSFDSIKNLRRDGQVSEANRRFDELSRQFPDNPEIKALGRIARFQDNINAESSLRSTKSDMMLAVQREILKASIPVLGEISFPDDWVEKSKRRSPGAKMSEEDRKILKAMSSPMTFSLKNEPLQSFLDVMERQFGTPLVIDQQAFQLLNITTETPISVNARGWSTRTVLKKVLADLGLAYVIKDKSINITSPERAKETMTTRAYPIGDVIGNMNFNMPNIYNQVMFMQSVQNIINSIMALDPDGWKPSGAGSIFYEPTTMSLIIRHSAEFHNLVGAGSR